ncbi:MAG: type II toxin-antitoxin system mRNA interferase toxin, RelE/StbE family [Candidatus Vecturithrix sp.]|jgi:addiction module RelE/StbE family toxin|nr:type II toxin-antitoxin system mRNA interferase toxin, RelE/StbE family [Candidatus Vecturithrix sp.]
MYHDQYHPRVKHDVKKLHATLREAIQTQHLPDILAHPERGEPLVGDLKGIWSYHFSFGKQYYRIAYMIDHPTETVIVVMIGKRGEFYQLLKRRVKG